MRVILKPAGLLFVTATVLLLAFLATANSRWRSENAGADAPLAEFNALQAKKGTPKAATPASPGLLETGPLALHPGAEEFASLAPLPPNEQPAGCRDGVRVMVSKRPAEFQKVQIRRKVVGATGEGQTLTLRFWARADGEAWKDGRKDESGRVSAFVGERDAVYTKSFFVTVTPGPVWKEHAFTFTAPAYRPGQAEARLLMGYKTGQFEIAGLRLE